MRVAYLDCFAGVAGDMFLGALLGAGVPLEVLQEATEGLGINARLKVQRVDRSGISAVKVHVLEGDAPVEGVVQQGAAPVHSHQPKTQHLHKGGHSHEHSHSDVAEPAHSHSHGRSLTVIREIIGKARLDESVKATAIRAFELLGHSEAKIHHVPVDSIHFHEVGAVDAIVDIVAASAGMQWLKIDRWYCSAVNVGSGMVQCAHGNFPVPAPATADLLREVPTYSAHVEKELTTPTGAALLRALAPSFGVQPRMRVEAIGYGAGTRNPEGFPNVLRLSVGESAEENAGEVVTVLETALDDLSPQLVAYAAERLLADGALDVMLTAVQMKKGRPGTLMTVLCEAAASERLQEVLFRETSTLGIRVRQDRRVTLDRRYVSVETEYGVIRVKVGSADGEEKNAAAEFADCREAAERCGVALKQVQQAALIAYGSKP